MESPELKASFLSRLTWHWMGAMISTGNKRPLEMSDLYELNQEDKAESCEQRWNECYEKEGSKRVLRVILRFLGVKFFLLFILRPLWLAALILQVYVIKELIHRSRLKSSRTWSDFLLVAGLFFLAQSQSLCNIWMFSYGWRYGVRLRAAFSMAAFNKMLSTRTAEFSGSLDSLLFNLVNSDTQKLIDCLCLLPYVVCFPFHLLVVSFFLCREAGIATLAGVAWTVVVGILMFYVAKYMGHLARRKHSHSDARVGILCETLAGIRIIKFNGWIPLFMKKINNARAGEMKWISKLAMISTIMYILKDSIVPFACLFAFGAYIYHHKMLDVTIAFVVLSFFSILARDSICFVYGLPQISNALVAVERLQKVLNLPNSLQTSKSKKTSNIFAIELLDCNFARNISKGINPKPIHMQIQKGILAGLIGKVGSGKSSLLYGILEELKLTQGSLFVEGNIAYSPQQPWILNDTMRNNIVFGSIFDNKRYDNVVAACALNHDISMLPNGSDTEIGERGVNLSGGQKARVSLARACYSTAPIILLDDPLSAVDASTAKYIVDYVLNGILKGRTVIMATHSIISLQACDEIYLLDTNNGIKHILSSSKDIKHEMELVSAKTELNASQYSKLDNSKGGIVKQETMESGNIKLSHYLEYLHIAGWSTFLIIPIFILGQGALLMVEYWIRVWTDNKYNLEKYTYLILFTCLGIFAIIISLLKCIILNQAYLTSSKNMHKLMVEKVFRSPLLFFDQNPIGRLLNRYSKDQAIADETLPSLIKQALEGIYASIGGLVLIGILVPWFLLTIPLALGILIYVRQQYISTGSALKRLDAISQSPIFAHFTETLQGAVSIRAYNNQKRFHDQLVKLVDNNHKAYILYVHASRWLSTRLDFVTTLSITVAAFLIVLLRNYISPGLTGVILVQTLKLTDVLQIAIKRTVEAESLFVSVERILEYCHLSTEATNKSEPRILSSNWPAAGSIEFINYTLAYREDLPAVLNNISFKIFPLEKIGIVGRTGAGKSSLAAAMFRMVENMACSGTILVDDIDIKTIGLDDLRQRLSIIPQDPVLFSGTLRFNMDPFGKNDDREIHEALIRAHFSSTQSYKNFDNGLDGQITSSGTNFSVGERQLLCLSRSLLRKSKILIMDEATAAVDNDTDQIIQATIRASFQDCTVLTVAHRIQTIIDNDRVLVMEAGRIAEFDTPKNLLKLTDGLFFNMVAHNKARFI
ncbi:canalicular multispecific organic anion transporter 2 [Selaginella moellendorffii]|uniref:canalicular multispecific organic anion transporter 2 n=1 Tax=Selaginella moellendorffii TaxID=88036 RepID=UPI000D1CB62F|nr:canalicular multispecific organic anion transporter 2 [Selaginella moellendorffii]|eukprot:XP_024516521.1 canalicular multispecific organic anion transporter 2 [Selaginella moellendorffii]